VTDLRIGRSRPRTVDLAMELIAASDDLITVCYEHTGTLPTGPRLRAAGVADDLAASAIADQVTPGQIHGYARQLVDVTDMLDDYGPHAAIAGVLGLTAARLHRLGDALAVTPHLESAVG